MIEKLQEAVTLRKKKKEEQRKERAKNPDWKGEKTSHSRVYDVISEQNYQQVANKAAKTEGKVQYLVDGVEWSKEKAMEIPRQSIEKIVLTEYRYRKFDTNGKFLHATPWQLDIKIQRKLSSALNAKAKDVYLVITENSDEEELRQAKKALWKLGFQIQYLNKRFEDGKLAEISVEVKDESGHYGIINGYSFLENPGSKVFLYRLGDSNEENTFGFGHGKDLDKRKEIPEKARRALKGINSGYMIGAWSTK